MSDMSQVRPQESSRCVVRGDLDLSTEPRVRKQLFDTLSLHPSVLVVDLGQVTFIDSSGLRVLLAARNRSQETGTRLVLAGIGPEVERTLQVANLKGFFEYERRATRD